MTGCRPLLALRSVFCTYPANACVGENVPRLGHAALEGDDKNRRESPEATDDLEALDNLVVVALRDRHCHHGAGQLSEKQTEDEEHLSHVLADKNSIFRRLRNHIAVLS